MRGGKEAERGVGDKEGRGRKRDEREGRGIPLQIKILATAVLLSLISKGRKTGDGRG